MNPRTTVAALVAVAALAACSDAGDGSPEVVVTDPTTSATTSTTPATAPPTSAVVTPSVVTFDGTLLDTARGRSIPYRAYLPDGLDGPVPLVLVSHGGDGNARGHLAAPHLGSTYAAAGFVAIHVGHLPSTGARQHRFDRPQDVSAVIDAIEAGTLDLPTGWVDRIDTTRIGHVGHSFGAYTAHALAGADVGDPNAVDARIDAIVPISPQGADQFGFYDRGNGDTSWASVTIPAYNLIGSLEMNDNAVGQTFPEGWRLTPFRSYPDVSDRFVTVIDGQDHSDMWRTGNTEVSRFIATESTRFLLAYVAGDPSVDACAIGVGDGLPVVSTERRPASAGSLLDACA